MKLYLVALFLMVAVTNGFDMETAWKKHLSRYPIRSKAELAVRKGYFATTHDMIQQFNSKSRKFQLAHNQFSALSPAEKGRRLGLSPEYFSHHRQGSVSHHFGHHDDFHHHHHGDHHHHHDDHHHHRNRTTTIPTTTTTTAPTSTAPTTTAPMSTAPTTTAPTSTAPTTGPTSTAPTTTAPTTTAPTTTAPTTTAPTTTAPTTTAPTTPTTIAPAVGVDYRTDPCMQPIKDQGGCGSCWAFATVAVVEFGHCVLTGSSVALSEQQVVDCDTDDGGCNGGDPATAFGYMSAAGGVDTSVSYPYVSGASGTGSTCQYNAANKGAVVSTSNPVTYIPSNDAVNTMINILNNRQLVTVAFAVGNSFFSYSNGVYTATDCNQNVVGYHAITAVGYGTYSDGTPYWVMRNQWGTGWGANGYILFQRGVNLCGIEGYAVTTTVVG